ncbi:hypothetical protein [Pedobacter sp.]
MDENNFKEILQMPEINKSAIAAKMYFPNSPVTAKTRLANKVNGTVAGSGAQRLTEEDLKKGEEVLRNLADAIYAKLSPLQNGQGQQP